MTVNVNEEIRDRTVRHAIFLERYKASEVRRIRKILNGEILPEIRDKIEKRLSKIIERGSDLGPETTARLKELEAELTILADGMASRLKKQVTGDVQELTDNELEWQANTIKQAVGFDLDLVVPSPRAVAAIASRASFAGLTLNQWFETLSNATQRGVMTAVNRGMVEGETTEQIIKRIRGTKALAYTDSVFETTRRQAETLARTVVNHVSNQSRMEFFKENDDLIKGLQWTATLDSRTSVVCAGLDGKIFPIDKGPRPPAHPNCRSTMTPVLKDWEGLGLNDPGAGKRASINGQVPASTTFGEWLKKQPIDVQDEVLGVSKAKLFRDGGVDISRFTDVNLKPLTLEQLRKLEKKAFKAVGL